jgi:iron(III) transport system ATP-binding protein
MLDIKSLNIDYGGTPAVQDVSLSLPAGAIGCLLGPSGCGKTTVLRTIAGFQLPSSGEVWLAGEPVSTAREAIAPEQRKVGMVLQDLALFPHLTVAENIGFGLGRLERSKRLQRIGDLLAITGLVGLEKSYPHELSGGQQQRVAIARAMAPKPKLLLLDEPFSSLDPDLRQQLPRDLRQIFREEQATVMLVTHDQAEAFAMADEIGVMRAGRLEQWDSAYGLYHRPATRFVADFIGEGVMLPGRVVDDRRVAMEWGVLSSSRPLNQTPDTPVDVLLRPDDVLHDDDSPLKARIVNRTFRGAHFLYTLALASGHDVLCLAGSHHDHQLGELIGIRAEIDHLVVFPQSPSTSESSLAR